MSYGEKMITASITRRNPHDLPGLKNRLKAATRKEVAVGFPRGKNGVTVPYYEDGSSILEVAVANNYGLGVPKRAFMELAAQNLRKWFPEYMKKQMPKVQAGKLDMDKVLEKAGEMGAGLVREAITDGDWKPNSEETKRRKGSDKPLIDTGAMRQHATWQVRPKS